MPAKRMTRNITHVIKKSSELEKPETPTRPNRYNQPVGNTSPERIFGVLTRSTSRVHTRYLPKPYMTQIKPDLNQTKLDQPIKGDKQMRCLWRHLI